MQTVNAKDYDPSLQICPRCEGRKKIYKVGAGYSHQNTGGVSVDCPFCIGKGKVKVLDAVFKDIEKNKKNKLRSKRLPKLSTETVPKDDQKEST
jgi:uncharacterized protein CbrC (UPF0167 family)